MNGQFFFALLNPAVGFLLAGAFAILWHYQREKRFIALIAAGYAASIFGYIFQDIGPALLTWPNRIASNLMFLAAGYLVTTGTIERYRGRAPHVALALLAIVGMAGYCWFLMAQPDLTARIYVMNFVLGAMALLTAFIIGKAEKHHPIDYAILVIWLLLSANFIVRTVIVLRLTGPYDSYQGFQYSIYWTSNQVLHAVLSVMLALSLIVAVALDVVDRLKAVSLTDELSGLLNRRGFDEAAGAALALTQAQGRPSALALADLDHFKAVNDTFGHAAGDRAIAIFAALLRETAPQGAVIGRVGGEEFAIFMPGVSLAAARLFCEGARIAIGAAAIPAVPSGSLSASFGVSVVANGGGLADALRRADEALYQAKRDGRDRVRAETLPEEIRPTARVDILSARH